jgi:hypothetical protein
MASYDDINRSKPDTVKSHFCSAIERQHVDACSLREKLGFLCASIN